MGIQKEASKHPILLMAAETVILPMEPAIKFYLENQIMRVPKQVTEMLLYLVRNLAFLKAMSSRVLLLQMRLPPIRRL